MTIVELCTEPGSRGSWPKFGWPRPGQYSVSADTAGSTRSARLNWPASTGHWPRRTAATRSDYPGREV